MRSLRKVISGGQTGVDQAALAAAEEAGLAVGGWCPPGRVCEDGAIPARFPLVETPRERSPAAPEVPRSQRTEWNVRDADATLILRPPGTAAGDPGSAWAARCAARFGRPLLVVDPWDTAAAEELRAWLDELAIDTLGVGGPSERTVPGIGARAHDLLLRVFGPTR
jgi:hypothetical protein